MKTKFEITFTVRYSPSHTAIYVIETDSAEYIASRVAQIVATLSTSDNRQAYEEG